MPNSIADYLLHLARNDDAWKRHHRSPSEQDAAMKEFGLSDSDAAIVRSADPAKIAKAVNDSINNNNVRLEPTERGFNMALQQPELGIIHALDTTDYPVKDPDGDP